MLLAKLLSADQRAASRLVRTSWNTLSFLARRGLCTEKQSPGAASVARHKSLYVVNVEGKSHLSPVLIGLFDSFQRSMKPDIGLFQPIAGEPYRHSTTASGPRHLELINKVFGLEASMESQVGVTRQYTVDMLGAGKLNDLLDQIYDAYEAIKRKHDFVIVEGTHGDASVGVPAVRLELNARIAAALETPVLMVLDAKPGRTPADTANLAAISRDQLRAQGAEVVGLVLNQVPPEQIEEVSQAVKQRLATGGPPVAFAGALPFNPVLATVRLDEVREALGARQLFGSPHLLDAEFSRITVASAGLRESLDTLAAIQPERPLVVTHCSRADILLGLLAAHRSGVGPHVSGLLVTAAGHKLPKIVEDIYRGVPSSETNHEVHMPVMMTDRHTFDVASTIAKIEPSILPTSQAKIEACKVMFSEHVDLTEVVKELESVKAGSLTPKSFQHRMLQMCQENMQRVVLPEGLDPRILGAAAEVTRRNLADVVLLGDPRAVQAQADKMGLDISRCQIVDHLKSPDLERYAEVLVEKRKKKNLQLEAARDMLQDANYFGTLMTVCGDADGMVSGACHTTASTIRPGLQLLRNKGLPLVSSAFFMCLPTKVLVYADCAVIPNPNSEELAMIAVTSADTAAAFGIEPRVAMLSYSTLGSGSGPDVDLVAKAVETAREMRPDLKLDGPMQYDAAVDPEVARVKVKTASDVAGRATVCIFPNLNTGNNTYKAVQQSTGAVAVGPIMQGFTKPVNDLSRGCTVADVVNTILVTSIQAMGLKKQAQ